MRRFHLLTIILLVCLSGPVFAQHSGMKMDAAEKPPALNSGLGSLHHPVTTNNPEAQRWFDQGMALVFAFNHDEAVRSFKRAAELDPKLAMAHWGEALALGPNINQEIDPVREKAAYEAVQKALALAPAASENERTYIAALAKRYSIDPKADLKKLDADYKHAMSELAKIYPDDLDAAVLYAEASMDLRPWKLWTPEGKPAPDTEEIVAVLESVLKRNPNHAGAIHYYIHTIEASPNPERALAYAPRLGELMPAAGHIVHMPAHIYERTGDYEKAAQSNRDAAAADRAYIKESGAHGLYPLMYYSHNLHFLAIANTMEGRLTDSLLAARLLEENVSPALKEMPMLEGFMTVRPLILEQFGRWDDILKMHPPDPAYFGLTAIDHFARGMAYASLNDSAHADEQQKLFAEAVSKIPADASFGLNPASKVMSIGTAVLSSRIAATKDDRKTALDMLRRAVAVEDSLAYDEPQTWIHPVREMLGGALLQYGDFAGAEQVFRTDLENNKRNGRSLFGLMESLKAQKKEYAAGLVQREYEMAWKNADVKLTVKDLWY